MRRSQTAPVRRALLDLFPEIMPYSSGFLDVDPPHSLYWEQCGNPDGVPVLFLHGGPGGGASAINRRFFNPDYYRIILFDQRGAGRSQPFGSLENNTLEHLVRDIEALRVHLNVQRWHLCGGSWGSTLALAYAQQFPAHCLSLIMWGIFTMEQAESDWFINGMKMVFPEAWEQFAALIPENERDDLLKAYYKRLTGSDQKEALDAAITWCLYESACASLLPNYETITTDEQKKQTLSVAKIESHYYLHQIIPAEKSLLKNIDKIRAIPATIIQGRYDMICPLITAHKLHALWPEADYIVVPDGGHSELEPAMRSRLIEATENARSIR